MKGIFTDYTNLTERDLENLFGISPEISTALQDAVPFRSFSIYTEVTGRMIVKMLEACGGYLDQVLSIFKHFGLSEIEPEDWIPEQTYLDALHQVASRTSPVLLNRMGAALADLALCLPGAKIDESILLLNQYYHRWHRRGEPGDFRLLRSNPEIPSIVVQCRHAYPCEVDMGLFKRLVQRITQKQQVMVFHDYRQSQNCRKNGAGACSLVISW